MSFEEKKVPAFEHPISQLADQPNMQPGELKSYFDANPEILRQGLNGLCDALGDTTAAANLGFAQTAGVPENTVQDAIENVQAQVTAAIIGSIPSGSIDGDKLAQDVRNRLTAIETAATTEASTRASADSNLQSQIDTFNTLLAQKSEVVSGTYTGNGEASQFISLGFTPSILFTTNDEGRDGQGNFEYGGLALPGIPSTTCTIQENGFLAAGSQSGNTEGDTYKYIAWK